MELTQEECRQLQTMPREEFETLCEGLADEELRLVLKVRCETDRELFARVFFEEDCYKPFSRMHHDFLEQPKSKVEERVRGIKRATAAPRGNAKSTIKALIDLVHDVVYQFERFIVIISDTSALSTDRCKDVRDALEGNERIVWVYGSLKGIWKWNTDDFVTSNRVRVMAKSMGKSVRGLKFGRWRPTKVVLDDAEDSDHVRQPAQRHKASEYLSKDILKAGKAYTNVEFIGTILHPDALLMRTLENPGWEATVYRSIISWPKRTDLWEEARKIYVDLTRGSVEKRYAEAFAFYQDHLEEMDEGVEVLWPEEEPIFDLYVQLWTEGEASFLSEKQNEPRDPSRQLFDMPGASWFRVVDDRIEVLNAQGTVARTVRIADCTLYGWLDPATGKNFGTDFSAIADLLVDRHGYAYVLDVWLAKVGQDEQVREMFRRHAHYTKAFGKGYKTFGFEDNGFQETYKPAIQRIAQELKAKGETWQLDTRGVTSSQNKEDRVSSMQPDVKNGWLAFNLTLRHGEFYEQMDQFPTGAHDDGPDAVERCKHLATTKPAQAGYYGGIAI